MCQISSEMMDNMLGNLFRNFVKKKKINTGKVFVVDNPGDHNS